MKKSLVSAMTAAGLMTACGGGSDAVDSSTGPVVLDRIPVSARGIVELGPISGGSVQFMRPSGQSLGAYTTSSSGELIYNPRDLISRLGSDPYIIVYVRGGLDIDADDDGFVDATPTPVRGDFRMIIMRSSLERGDPIVVNSRAGLVSEILLGRTNPRIEQGILDQLAQETGAQDQNNDGKVDYKDIISVQMKNTQGVSKVVPFVSGYIASVHAGSTPQKNIALRNVARTESAIMRSIVPHPTENSHIPMLKLQSISGGNILYTLDGSAPIVGGSSTRTAQGEVTIPMQNAKLYYREQFQLNGETIVGRVRSFDLVSDWTELSQETLSYNQSGSPSTATESLTYKNIPYTITTIANQVNPAYTYPKTIGCKVGAAKDAGCHYGPYMVWSPEHENKVRGLITLAAKKYIDSLGTTNPALPLEERYRDNILYNGANYSMIDTWTSGANGTRTFPVQINVTIRWNNGNADYTTTRTVNTQADLDRFHTQLEISIKEYIDSENSSSVPTYPRNHTLSYTGGRVNNYFGGWYELFNTYNLSGTSNYPVQISGSYNVLGQGTRATAIVMAADDAERVQKSNQIISEMQAAIRAGQSATPPPTYPRNHLIDSGFVSYRNGYGYRTLTTMNITGTSDYPATVRVAYTTPLSSNNTTQTLTANNAAELLSIQTERVNEARARIDQVLNADQYPPNHVETVTNTTSYGGGAYRTTFTYSGNPGQDYPGYLDTYITYRNGSSDKLVLQVDSSNAKNTQALSLESQARLQIDNYNPTYAPNTITSDGPYSYGSRGSNYTYKVSYNRVGTGANYPALVWIEYRSTSTGTLRDTRTTYGNMIAVNSVEKEQMKATLLNFVRGQMVAQGGVDTPVYATASRLHELLPFSTAHAQSQNSVLVRKAESQLPNFAPALSGLMYGQFYGNSGTAYQHWVSNRANTKSVATSTQSAVALKQTIATIGVSVEKIRFSRLECTGQGTTYDPSNPNHIAGCILTPYQESLIRQEEIKIINTLSDYLKNFGIKVSNDIREQRAIVTSFTSTIWDGIKSIPDFFLNIDTLIPSIEKAWTDYTTKYSNNSGGVDVSRLWYDMEQWKIGLQAYNENMMKSESPEVRGEFVGSLAGNLFLMQSGPRVFGFGVHNLGKLKIGTIYNMINKVEKVTTQPELRLQALAGFKNALILLVRAEFANIQNADDIIQASRRAKLLDTFGPANIVYGNIDSAELVINRLRLLKWNSEGRQPAGNGTFYENLISPDGLQKVTIRTESTFPVPGYTKNAGIDVYKNIKLNNNKTEIKFVTK